MTFRLLNLIFLVTQIYNLAIDACSAGQGATTTVNAANEIAVDAFLNGKIGFTDIYKINAQTLEAATYTNVQSLDEILECDKLARISASAIYNKSGALICLIFFGILAHLF